MVYIKENGVTVGDFEGSVVVSGLKISPDGDGWLTPSQSEALLRGLLRWKLENEGEIATDAWFNGLMRNVREDR